MKKILGKKKLLGIILFNVTVLLYLFTLSVYAMSSFSVDIPAGYIIDQKDAEKKCPIICEAHLGKWNGKWRTVIDGEMSICGCSYTIPAQGTETYTIDIPIGPVYSSQEAKEKCPIICESYGGKWNGKWKTVAEGKISVCGCTFIIPDIITGVDKENYRKNNEYPFEISMHDIDTYTLDIPVGPVFNQQDAEKKCPIICAAHSGKWTGVWQTIIPNKMSVCSCAFIVPDEWHQSHIDPNVYSTRSGKLNVAVAKDDYEYPGYDKFDNRSLFNDQEPFDGQKPFRRTDRVIVSTHLNHKSASYTIDIFAGPILNQKDADEKCPIVCASYGGKWNGQWKTIITGKMSVCGCIIPINNY